MLVSTVLESKTTIGIFKKMQQGRCTYLYSRSVFTSTRCVKFDFPSFLQCYHCYNNRKNGPSEKETSCWTDNSVQILHSFGRVKNGWGKYEAHSFLFLRKTGSLGPKVLIQQQKIYLPQLLASSDPCSSETKFDHPLLGRKKPFLISSAVQLLPCHCLPQMLWQSKPTTSWHSPSEPL